MSADAEFARPPAISVVVPVHRAASTIERCLRSLIDQTADPDTYEVLMVLNGPEDGSREIIARLATAHPTHRIRLLECAAASAGAARNAALDALTGGHVVFVDADDWVSPNYLAEMAAAADGVHVPVAGLVDVLPDGTVEEDTAVMRSLGGKPDRYFAFHTCVSVSGMSACKALPTAWVGDQRFAEDLRSGEDVVFNGRVLAPFGVRFGSYDRQPYDRGAIYYRYHAPGSVSRQTPDFDFAVAQRLAVLDRLTADGQRDPQERARLTDILVDAQSAMIRRYLDRHPENLPAVRRAVAEVDIPGLTVEAIRGAGQWPTLAGVSRLQADPIRHVRVTVAADDARTINALRTQLRIVQGGYVSLHLAVFRGALAPALQKVSRHRFTVIRERGRRAEHLGPAGRPGRLRRRLDRAEDVALRTCRKTAPHVLPGPFAARVLPAADHEGVEFLAHSDTVIALDAVARAWSVAAGRESVPVSHLHALTLAAAARGRVTSHQHARAVARSAEALADLPADSPHLPPADVWAMAAWRLIRAVRVAEARTVLAAARHHFPDCHDSSGLDLLEHLAEAIGEARLSPAAGAAAERAMAVADAALAEGDIDRTVFLTECAAEVLLSPEVQANVAEPPLIRDPQGLVAPLAGSRTWHLLTGPAPASEAAGAPRRGTRPDVLVLPGAYPKFARVVAEALAEDADVTVLPLAELERRFSHTAVSPLEIRERLLRSMGRDPGVRPDIAEAFRGRDIVFADWADKGAVLASLFAPREARLVVRFHGVDSLALWQFLVDWTRVTDIVFVSRHLQTSVERTLGDRIAHTRKHIIDNGVEVDRFDRPSLPEADRTLGMVGWAQKVKDPLWAVELLARLRQQDPTWRLLLIGNDFPVSQARISEDAYARRFRQRVLEPDVAGAVEYVGYTHNLPRHAARVGFAISASLRESSHIGAVELVAGGALPVFRNWPVYAPISGTASLFGEEWTVNDLDAAAARILAHADPGVRASAAEEARSRVRRHFSARDTTEDYRRILLGSR